MAVAGVQAVTVFNHAQGDEIRSRSRASSIVQMWKEMEDEYRSSPGRERRQDIISRMNSYESNYSTASEEEREWPQGNRKEWLGEMEQERVRVIRAWVHLTSQQREPAGQIEQVLDGLVGYRKGIQRLCGRQALLDMLKKAERERRIEIAKVAERRAVSRFPHRLRIQAVLRGRFLRNSGDRIGGEVGLSKRRGNVSAIERGCVVSKFEDMKKENRNDDSLSARADVPASVLNPASKVPNVEPLTEVQAPDAAITSAIEGTFERTTSIESDEDRFRLKTEDVPPKISIEIEGQYSNLLAGDQVDTSESEIEEDASEIFCRDSDQFFLAVSPMGSCDLWRNVSGDSQDLEGHYSNLHYDCRTEASMSEKEEDTSDISCHHSEQFFLNITPMDTFILRVPENSQNNVQYGSLHTDTRDGEDASDNSCQIRPANTFDLRNDDRANTSELRELFNRRSVSTLLNSSFSRTLNELLQSHIQRESHTEDDADTSAARDDSHYATDWDTISELRMDMERLRQRLNGMQRMVEACMGMQLKLQKSITREIASAGSWSERDRNFDCVRRGVCCVCQSSSIDSLLYRCGHMCTCHNCANELISSDEKCPMCRAPVAEVFQVYSL